jgi:hypothetical protein
MEKFFEKKPKKRKLNKNVGILKKDREKEITKPNPEKYIEGGTKITDIDGERNSDNMFEIYNFLYGQTLLNTVLSHKKNLGEVYNNNYGDIKDSKKREKESEHSCKDILDNMEAEEFQKIENSQEKKLDLSDNSIAKIKDLNHLTYLYELNLSKNKIWKIENLKELNKLRRLDLSNNKILKIKNLETLKDLRKLDLSKNRIKTIPFFPTFNNLSEIDLSNNRISEIQQLSKLPKLTKLNLSNNRIKKIENLKKRGAGRKKILSLEKLDLHNNPIENFFGLKELNSVTAVKLDMPYNKMAQDNLLKVLKDKNVTCSFIFCIHVNKMKIEIIVSILKDIENIIQNKNQKIEYKIYKNNQDILEAESIHIDNKHTFDYESVKNILSEEFKKPSKEDWVRQRTFSNEYKTRNFDSVDQDDSSDEEEEDNLNQKYNIFEIANFKESIKEMRQEICNISDYDIRHSEIFEDKKKELNQNQENINYYNSNITDNQVIQYFRSNLNNISTNEITKSSLLHNFGRMHIYSPNVNDFYRNKKKSLTTSFFRSKKCRLCLQEQNLYREEFYASHKLINNQNEPSFPIKNLTDLLGTGRFLRRSQIRKSRELKDMNKDDSFNTATKIDINFSSFSKETSSTVIETLMTSKKGLGRAGIFPNCDMVFLGKKGDYLNIRETIKFLPAQALLKRLQETSESLQTSKEVSKEIKETFNLYINLTKELAPSLESNLYSQKVSDQKISQLITDVCRGKNINISDSAKNIVYSLTYLLFKTEVYRSPAALINNMQMLELIEFGKLSFEKLFAQQMMPMSMKGAIQASRSLSTKYNKKGFGFYYYSNPFKYSPYSKGTLLNLLNEKDLIKKESNLMDMWLRMKLEHLGYQSEKIRKFLEEPTKPEHLNVICKQINELGINFGLSYLEVLRDKNTFVEKESNRVKSGNKRQNI